MGDHICGENLVFVESSWLWSPLCFFCVLSCGYLGLFLLLVACSCIYVCCFHYSGAILSSDYLCWWFLVFCFAGVVAFSLTMRILWHIGVGVESHALTFCKKMLQKKILFVGFLEFCTIFDWLLPLEAWLLACTYVNVHDRFLSQVCPSTPRF